MIMPDSSSLSTWSSSVITDFPNDNVPILDDEEKWREWGDTISSCQTFATQACPATHNYEDWKSWAQDVYFSMSNFTSY